MSCVDLPSGDVFAPVKVEENDLFGGIQKILQFVRPLWHAKNIKYKVFTDGITNKLVACQNLIDNCIVLVRIYGNKTDLLIDRTAELRNIKILNKYGMAPEVYGTFENGLVYQYFPGVTLNVNSVVENHIWSLVAKEMGRMHRVKLGVEIKKEPMTWDKTEQFMQLLPERFSSDIKQKRFVDSFGSITKLRIEFERLKSHLIKTESPIVFAHNDLLLGNVIYDEVKQAVYFIDYEYAAYNYQAFDIANHFNEYVGISSDDINYERYPNKEFQLSWIRVYLTEYLDDGKFNESDVERIYKEVQQMSLASHFLWGIWSLVQYELSDIDFDFGRYAEIRLQRYYEMKNTILKEMC